MPKDLHAHRQNHYRKIESPESRHESESGRNQVGTGLSVLSIVQWHHNYLKTNQKSQSSLTATIIDQKH